MASQPTSRLWTPSSRSIISSARASASRLTSAEGWCRRTVSSLITKKPRRAHPAGLGLARQRSVDLDAFFGEELDRPGVPRNRRSLGLLVLELDVLGLLVHPDQLVAMVEHGLDDVVRRLVVHVLVHHQQVGDGRRLVVRLHALVDGFFDDILDVDVAVLL